MDKVNSVNSINLNKIQSRTSRSVTATRPIPNDSFEKSGSDKAKKETKAMVAVLAGIVALFAAYRGAKYLKKIIKPKTSVVEDGVKVVTPTKIEKPKAIEAPKKTKIDETLVKDAEIIETNTAPKEIVKETEMVVKPAVAKGVVKSKSLEPTEKAKQLAEEYKQLSESRQWNAARQKQIELKDEGFVLFNGKLVHKTSKEAFAPMEVRPTQELYKESDLAHIECPGILKVEDKLFAKPSNPEKFGIENISVATYDYTSRGYGTYYRENSVLLKRDGGMSECFPEAKRSWVMGHDYLQNFKTRKNHYVTTLAFGEGLNANGRPPGFVLSLEGDYSAETMEALKNRLIETGMIDDLILKDSFETGKELMSKIVDETIAFMNKK